MTSLLEKAYNPDVLTCLANLSNDEVFTPPELANDVLDMLPPEIWSDPTIKILDPCCKSGVFLREAAKRFIKGLEHVYPDLQERVEHIMHEQLFGIAITELTSLLSRRSLYCSKFPNGRFSVAEFDSSEGNVRHRTIQHTWVNNRCKYCGASNAEYDRDATLETHAYEFIHAGDPERILNMKFDVIVGNPPYQLSDGGNGASASPIYHLFVEQAKKLNPRYLAMIIPSRYFAGGKGLTAFRQEMLSDSHITKMVDFINAKDCFPQNSVGGGVNYFLWERDRESDCEITTVRGIHRSTAKRKLNEFPVFVRYNEAISVIHKMQATKPNFLGSIVTSRNPFGYPTSFRGDDEKAAGKLALHSSKGLSYVDPKTLEKGDEYLERYKVMISRIIYEHACEPDKEGKMRVLSKIEVLGPQEVCTDSYLIIGPLDSQKQADNLRTYLKTKFVRFLVAQTLSSINLSKDKFCFVPILDFNETPTDQKLYERYGLSSEEVEFIEGFIHEME